MLARKILLLSLLSLFLPAFACADQSLHGYCAQTATLVLQTGGLTSSWARFGPIVKAELAEGMLAIDPPRIEVTADVELARLRGAAALVLQRHSGYHRSKPEAPNGKSIRKRKDRVAVAVRA